MGVAGWRFAHGKRNLSERAAIAAKEAAAHEWQAAIEALMLVVELGGPTMFARIGIRRALNLSKPAPEIEPRRKPAKAYRLVK